MKSILSRKDFYELRNQLYGRLVEEKELKDNDNNFILIEDIICETINIDWESYQTEPCENQAYRPEIVL